MSGIPAWRVQVRWRCIDEDRGDIDELVEVIVVSYDPEPEVRLAAWEEVYGYEPLTAGIEDWDEDIDEVRRLPDYVRRGDKEPAVETVGW